MRLPSLALGLGLLLPATLTAQVATPEAQIAGATSAAPEAMRAGATVLGYNSSKQLVTLRQGTNELICLADDPSDEKWQVSCYHKDLEPFMRRGRELKAQGIARGAEDSVRGAEIQAGKLKMPEGPRVLFNVYSPVDSVDKATGIPRRPAGMQVIYIPYATTQTTGLPEKPGGGLPWLMFPGKPWAHVMIMK